MPYIDVDQLCQKVDESKYNNPHEGILRFNHRVEHDHFLNMILNSHIADVVPVVHGQWLKGVQIYCSVCGEYAHTNYQDADVYEAFLTPYCHGCGAKMDLEE